MYTALSLAKSHLNIEQSYNSEDTYITHLINMAEARVEQHIDVPFEFIEDASGNLPTPVTHAILLLVGSAYNFRESELTTATTSVSHGYEYLLAPYRDYSGLFNGETYTQIVDAICSHMYVNAEGNVVVNTDWLSQQSATYQRIAERILSTATIDSNGNINITTL